MSVTDIPRRFDNPPDSRAIRPSPGKRGHTVLGGILLVLLVFLLVAEASIGTETRAGGSDSTADTVSLLVAQPVGPAGFIYANGTQLMINGQPILLFGVDEQTSFIYGMIGSGLWGGADPNAWGNNNLFPTGIGSRISGVTDADSLYREFFRYFLHYNQVAGSAQNPKIAMWDLFNEPEGNNEAYFNGLGGITAYRAWATKYIADVRSASVNHLLTIGSANSPYLTGLPPYGAAFDAAFNDLVGLDVSHHHIYSAAEDQLNTIDLPGSYHAALGKPHYEGEFGYWQDPGPSGLGYGYWPWFAAHGQAAGWAAITTMVFLNNGDRKSTRLNSSHGYISYAVFCLKKKKTHASNL